MASRARARRRPPAPTPRVRDMVAEDVPEVLAIERDSYPTPWPRQMFLDEIARRGSVCLVAQVGEQIVGYTVAATYAEVWHILNVCVRPGRRRSGHAERLLHALFARGDGHAHRGYTLEVRLSNTAAIALYGGIGFISHGVRPGYYSDNREDALIMWRAGEP